MAFMSQAFSPAQTNYAAAKAALSRSAYCCKMRVNFNALNYGGVPSISLDHIQQAVDSIPHVKGNGSLPRIVIPHVKFSL